MNNPTNLDSQTDAQSANKNQFAITTAPEAALLVKEETLPSSAGIPDSAICTQHSSSHRQTRRKGRIACLPKVQRDMVNHMLWNAIPYKNIVAALDEAGFTVTERNISNWATGGYLEWS